MAESKYNDDYKVEMGKKEIMALGTEQQSLLESLDPKLSKFMKTPTDNRTIHQLKKPWESIVATFSSFDLNERIFRYNGVKTPDDHYPLILNRMNRALNLVRNHAPDLVLHWGNGEIIDPDLRKDKEEVSPTKLIGTTDEEENNPSLVNISDKTEIPPTTAQSPLGAVKKDSGKQNNNLFPSRIPEFEFPKWEDIPNSRHATDQQASSTEDPLNKMCQSMMKAFEAMSTKFQTNAVPENSLRQRIPICIPQFKGEIIHYSSFKETFTSVISKDVLNDVEKLQLLRQHLIGEPLDLVSHLRITSCNYSASWELLDDSYGSKQAIVNHELECLDKMPMIIFNDVNGIKTACNSLRRITYNLKASGINLKECSPLLTFMIKKKFDRQTRFEFNRMFPEKDLGWHDYSDLEKFLQAAFKLQCNLASEEDNPSLVAKKSKQLETAVSKPSINYCNNNARPRTAAYFCNDNDHHSTAAFLTCENHPVKDQKKLKNCMICRDAHKTINCPQLLDNSDKVNFLKRYRICTWCASHRWKHNQKCRKRRFLKCNICGNNHESNLHISKLIPKERCSKNQSQQSLQPPLPDEDEDKLEILLPTVIVDVYNQGGEMMKLRALVDNCSESNYITSAAANFLKLHKRQKHVNIYSVGGKSSAKATKVTTVNLKLGNQMSKHETLIIPQITTCQPSSVCSKEWVPENIQLADPNFNQPAPIDMIIGVKVLPKLLENDIKTVEGYLLTKTKLGYMILGSNVPKKSQSKSLCFLNFNSRKNQNNFRPTSFWKHKKEKLKKAQSVVTQQEAHQLPQQTITQILEDESIAESQKYHTHPDFHHLQARLTHINRKY